jgi:NAD(P)H-dependent flavin oxidoreductase YrpB (nitropropane dioxygenase family)
MDERSGMIDYDLLTKSEVSVPKSEGGSATAASSIHGEYERNYFAGGQGVGLINQIISCKDLIKKIMKEADTAKKEIKKL